MKGAKTPWVAAVLAFVLGGPGWVYLGWRRGAKATLGWLLLVPFILVNAKLLEPTVFFLILLQVVLAWMAYRSCKRSNAEVANAASSAVIGTVRPDGVTRSTGRKPLTGWKRAAWILGKSVFVVVGVIVLMLVLFFIDLGLVDWHYKRMQRSVRSGMTIEQVLRTVQESGGVNGYPQHLGDEKIAGVHLYGPRNGTYSHRNLTTNQNEELPEGEAATLLRQNMVPGCNYRIGFTFTPMYGPHWSMTVILSPEGRVKEVQPFHTWD